MEDVQLTTGSVVDRYTIEGVLGEGGMAVVFRVRHNLLGTSHALKVLTVNSNKIQERLRQEGRLQGQLKHPNIVAVTDVVEVGQSHGLVLEFVDGPSLDQWIRGHERLTVEQLDALVPGILAGVAAAHRQGFIHRDLKPANVLLAPVEGGYVPKVADFGLAKALGDSDLGNAKTRTGSTMGTPHYMSPEQVRDSKNVGPRSDIFALGAILYEMVTGTRAFEGADLLEIFNKVAHARYEPLDKLASVPERMEKAITAALQVDPEARPASVEALAELWGVTLDTTLLPVSAPSVAPVSNPTYAESLVSGPPATSGTGVASKAAVAIGLGGGLLGLLGVTGGLALVVAAGGILWMNQRPDPVVVFTPIERTDRDAGTVPVLSTEPTPTIPEVTDNPEIEATPAPELTIPELLVNPPEPADRAQPAEATAALETTVETTEAPAPPEVVPVPAVTPEPVEAQSPEAFGMLASRDPADRRTAVTNLVNRLHERGAMPLFERVMREDPDSTVKRAAWSAAAERYQAGNRDVEPIVVWQMGHGIESIALEAVAAYRTLGTDPRSFRLAMVHRSSRVRAAVASAVLDVALRRPDSLEIDFDAFLAPLLKDSDSGVRRRAEDTLSKVQ